MAGLEARQATQQPEGCQANFGTTPKVCVNQPCTGKW
jgi:hypothetical protein